MKQTLLLITAAIFLLGISCNGSKTITKVNTPVKSGVRFVKSESLQPLLAKAKAENKLVFIDFYTDWCLPCKIMDEEVFSHQSTGDNINRNFISYKVNAEKKNGPQLSTIFNVYAYPTLLFLDADGKILERKDGSVSTSQFLNLAEKALAQSL